MKSGAFAVGAFFVSLVVFAACNGEPTQPPIETSGSVSHGNVGGAASGAAADASVKLDAAEGDAEVADGGDGGDAGLCSSLTCPAGCCSGTGACVLVFTNAECGSQSSFGAACQICGANQTCQPGGTCL